MMAISKEDQDKLEELQSYKSSTPWWMLPSIMVFYSILLFFRDIINNHFGWNWWYLIGILGLLLGYAGYGINKDREKRIKELRKELGLE